jgi:hypothetical protein
MRQSTKQEASIRSVAAITGPRGTFLRSCNRRSSHATPVPIDLRVTGEMFRLIERIPFESPPFYAVYDHLRRA